MSRRLVPAIVGFSFALITPGASGPDRATGWWRRDWVDAPVSVALRLGLEASSPPTPAS